MPIIGMIHLRALPGASAFSISFKHVLDTALTDAKALTEGGIDGFILENFGDVPFYPDKVSIHTIAYMTRIASEVKRQFQHLWDSMSSGMMPEQRWQLPVQQTPNSFE